MVTNDFEEEIKPFFWVQHDNSVSVCLNVGDYKNEIFQTIEDEGFEGSGYDWTSLAKIFLSEKRPDLIEVIKFDPEASMFCAYSSNTEALKTYILSFKNACENEVLIQDLFSQVELD